MIYRLKELQGDTIAGAPAGVFQAGHRGGVQRPGGAVCAGHRRDRPGEDLRRPKAAQHACAAESALSFWAGAGLLERYEENAAPGEEPSAPAPMTWQEIAAASRTDPMISSLIDCAQAGFARPLTHSEMERLVNLYLVDGFAPETVMLCVAYVASRGKRTMAAVNHELKVWRAEGVETGEQADAHLKLLALRAQREQYVSGLLGIAGKRADPRRAESHCPLVRGVRLRRRHGAGSRCAGRAQAGPVVLEQHPQNLERQGPADHPRCAGPCGGRGCQPEHPGGPRDAPSGNDFLKNAARRRPLKKKPE